MKTNLQEKIALLNALQMNDNDWRQHIQHTWYCKFDGIRILNENIENWDENNCEKLTYADLLSERVIADISHIYGEIKRDTLVFIKNEEVENSQKGQHEQYKFHRVLIVRLRAQIIEDAIDELLRNGGQFNSAVYAYDRNNLKIHTRLLTIDNATIENNLFLNELIQELIRFNIIVKSFRDNVTQVRFEINLDMLLRNKIEKH